VAGDRWSAIDGDGGRVAATYRLKHTVAGLAIDGRWSMIGGDGGRVAATYR